MRGAVVDFRSSTVVIAAYSIHNFLSKVNLISVESFSENAEDELVRSTILLRLRNWEQARKSTALEQEEA
jgi:hypothetical protein